MRFVKLFEKIKKPILCFFSTLFLLGGFFYGTTVNAWQSCSVTYLGNEDTTPVSSLSIMHDEFMMNMSELAGVAYSSTTDFAISSITIPLARDGTGGSVYANIMDASTQEIVATSTNTINISTISQYVVGSYDVIYANMSEETFNFSPLTLTAGNNYYILVNGKEIAEGDRVLTVRGGTGNNDAIMYRYNFGSTADVETYAGQSYTDISFYCEDEPTSGSNMPTFVGGTISFLINLFVSLFTLVIVFTVVNLWAYLLGVTIILLAVRYGKKLLRI